VDILFDAEDDGVLVSPVVVAFDGVPRPFDDEDLECSVGFKRFSALSRDGGCSDFVLRVREFAFSCESSVLGTSKFLLRERAAVTPGSPLARSVLGLRPERLGRRSGPGAELSVIPGPMDFRGGRAEIPVDERVDAWLWRRVREPGAGGGGMVVEALAEWPVSRLTSLCLRNDPDRAALPVVAEPLTKVPGVGRFIDLDEVVDEYPAPPWPGRGKWLRLGSPMMLLWKSSKLMGARKSIGSEVFLFVDSSLVDDAKPVIRVELLL
jgi:hypothetical protein